MRKNLLFVWMVLMLVIVSGFKTQAQTWTPPTLTGSTLTSGTTYYVYNVGANGYLNRGGWWGTMSDVSAAPNEAWSTKIIKWTAVNTSGSTWTFQYNKAGSDVNNNFLFAANASNGDVFTDNSSDNTWNVVLTDAATNTYSIQVVSTYGGYNAAQYLGSVSAAVWTNKGTAGEYTVSYNKPGGDNYTQWKFASQADMDLYNARVLLDRYMNYVKKRGGFDLSSYITTYNAGVTADINKAAGTLLAALGRTDVTSSITNPSFETDALLTGWTNSGGFVNQTNNDAFFTKDGTNYTEKWVNSPNGNDAVNLPTGAVTQTISGLANGYYGLVASGHAKQKAGGNPLHSGAFFKAGTDSTEISSGGEFNVDYALVTDGTLTIGFELTGAVACNWAAFDNFRLYYYGNGAIPPKVLLSPASLTFLSGGTKKVGVTGYNLTNPISITAPANFSVSPSTLAATVNGDSVAITYDGGATASGYVVFTSGAVKDSIQVTGTADPIITANPTSLTLDDLHLTGSFSVNGINLTSDITITTPTGITVNPTTIPKGSASNVTISVTYDGTTTPLSGDIVVTSGILVKKVAVTAFSSAACFTPLYASGNMIADPTFNAATLSEGGFGGWGPTAITHTRQYCGRGAAYIRGTCYPDGGSIDRALNTANGNALKPNAKYRLRAMLNSQASGGKTFQFQIEGVNGTASQYFQIGNTNGWKQFDTTFVTGATVTEKGIYFNSCYKDGAVAPPITDTCFIDNYELYEVPYIATSSLSLTYSGASTKKVAVTARKLTSDITITAPVNFTVTPATLLSTVAGDSVAITYDGVASAGGYVVFTSGTVKDSLLVLVAPNPPLYTIDFASETTNEVVPATDEYSLNADMSSATDGAGIKLSLTPGQNLYYRTKASGLIPASATQTLVVPARPVVPAYTVDFISEKTTQVVPATDEYATSSGMSTVTSGAGAKVTVTPAQNLYFRVKATASAFKSAVQTLTVAGRPNAPFSPVSDDNANTFDWTNNPSFNSVGAYEFSINSGSTWTTATAKPINVGNVDLAIGAVQVRVKANTDHFCSLALSSTVKYTLGTGISVASSGILTIHPNPVKDIITIDNLTLPAQVSIVSVSGKLVFATTLTVNTLNVGNLPNGVYFIKLSTKEGTKISKIVKE